MSWGSRLLDDNMMMMATIHESDMYWSFAYEEHLYIAGGFGHWKNWRLQIMFGRNTVCDTNPLLPLFLSRILSHCKILGC